MSDPSKKVGGGICCGILILTIGHACISDKIERNKKHAELIQRFENDQAAVIKEINELIEKQEIDQARFEIADILKDKQSIELTELDKKAQIYDAEGKAMLGDDEQKVAALKELLKLKPEDKKFIEGQLAAIEKRRINEQARQAKLVAKFGEPPSAGWVEYHIKLTANDPKSISFEGCSDLKVINEGWLIGCDYRGKNGFGALVLQSNWFVIRNGVITKVLPASAYKR